MPRSNGTSRTLLGRLPSPERAIVAGALRAETVGGIMLLAAAAAALVWANTPLKSSYEVVREFHFGVPALGLDLSVAHSGQAVLLDRKASPLPVSDRSARGLISSSPRSLQSPLAAAS